MRAQFRFDLLQFAIVLVTAIIFNPFIVLGQRNDPFPTKIMVRDNSGELPGIRISMMQ